MKTYFCKNILNFSFNFSCLIMKKFVLLFLITAVSLSVFSQEDFDEEDRKGNFIFEPYIGITNAAATIFEQENQNNYNILYTNKSMPVQLGFKMEYMLTYNIGIGLDYNYEQAGFSLEDTMNNSISTYSQTKTRYLGRFYYHPIQREKFDMYLGAGFGITNISRVNPQNEPDELNSVFFPIRFIDKITDPFAGRIFVGFRAVFTKNIGAFGEFGIGSGSVLNLGVSARF